MLKILQELLFILGTIMSFLAVPISTQFDADETGKFVITTLIVWAVFVLICVMIGV